MDTCHSIAPDSNEHAKEVCESILKLNIDDTGNESLLPVRSDLEDEDVDLDTDTDHNRYRQEDEGENQIYFNPSVCTQRYNTVRETLIEYLSSTADASPVTLIEFGCAELRLHMYLKHISKRVTKLVYVDKDDSLLETMKMRIRPLAFEYLQRRETPLKVEIFSGDVVQCDPRILETSPPTFAVIGIELIEHLDPQILLGFERTVFGLLRPPLVILTTPNSEFNVVFKLAPGTFRHWDHRFEWTRAQFSEWCDRICREYGGYSYEIKGIGHGPSETGHLGCVSQMVVFRKIFPPPSLQRDYSGFTDIIIPDSYRLVMEENYPFFVDTTPRDEKIYNAFRYHIANYVLNYSMIQEYHIEEKTEVYVPLTIAKYISGLPPNVNDLEEVRLALVKWEYNVQQNSDSLAWEIVLKVPEEDPNQGYYWEDGKEEMESDDNNPYMGQILEVDNSNPHAINTVPDSTDPDWDSEDW